MDVMVTFVPQAPYPQRKGTQYFLYSSLSEFVVEGKNLLPLVGIKA